MIRGRICALLLILALAPCVRPVRAADGPLERAAEHVLTTVDAPAMGSVGGEWAALGLARSGADVPEEWYRTYWRNAARAVREKGGVLHTRKYSEYSRVILALRAVGADPTHTAGYDLTAPLSQTDRVLAQGVNGAIWALIALDCGPYGTPELRSFYRDELLARQLADGGWAVMGDRADVDVTAMALQALAPHRAVAEAAVEAGTRRLAALIGPGGDCGSAESTAQALVAVCRLGLYGRDDRFDALTGALLTYARPDGGFAHTSDQAGSDPMASEQALYALAAVRRAREGRSDLYAMDDVSLRHPAVTPKPVTRPGRTFPDLAGHADREAVETLAERAILAGGGDGLFRPDEALTRAQFAALVVQALGLDTAEAVCPFSDAEPGAWYVCFLAAAYEFGLVSGVGGGRFAPEGTISREQAAVMLTHAAALCAMDVRPGPADALGPCDDGDAVSPWAREAVAFCRRTGVWGWDGTRLDPDRPVLRCEMARMLCRLLAQAGLLQA